MGGQDDGPLGLPELQSLVKMAQRRGLRGTQGTWADYAKVWGQGGR